MASRLRHCAFVAMTIVALGTTITSLSHLRDGATLEIDDECTRMYEKTANDTLPANFRVLPDGSMCIYSVPYECSKYYDTLTACEEQTEHQRRLSASEKEYLLAKSYANSFDQNYETSVACTDLTSEPRRRSRSREYSLSSRTNNVRLNRFFPNTTYHLLNRGQKCHCTGGKRPYMLRAWHEMCTQNRKVINGRVLLSVRDRNIIRTRWVDHCIWEYEDVPGCANWRRVRRYFFWYGYDVDEFDRNFDQEPRVICDRGAVAGVNGDFIQCP